MISKLDNPVFVTQPALPPIEEFTDYIKEIWKNKWLTNDGPYHEKFEAALGEYLGIKYLSLFSNGTLALITALQSMRISGEVITTPYSFVATTHALWWNNIKPVFVDIEPEYCNIDPEKIEAAITPKTTAIMPVHVYGNPCDIVKIEKIASTYGLKILYDAAHAFGVNINQNSVLNFGDLSVLSFHATKVFSTIEGGAIICPDEKTKKRIDYMKNFGFVDEVTVIAPGINAKMNEFQSAFGLMQLAHVDNYIEKRKKIANIYREGLKDIEGIRIINDIDGVRHNYSYFPIFIESNKYGISRDDVYNQFKLYNIFTRRYFYPLISQFPIYSGLPSSSSGNLPTAIKIAKEVLCLPIYPELKIEDVEVIIDILKFKKFNKIN